MKYYELQKQVSLDTGRLLKTGSIYYLAASSPEVAAKAFTLAEGIRGASVNIVWRDNATLIHKGDNYRMSRAWPNMMPKIVKNNIRRFTKKDVK